MISATSMSSPSEPRARISSIDGRCSKSGPGCNVTSEAISRSAILCVLSLVLLQKFGVAQFVLDPLLVEHLHVEFGMPSHALVEPSADVAFAEMQIGTVRIRASGFVDRRKGFAKVAGLKHDAIKKIAALRVIHPHSDRLVVFGVAPPGFSCGGFDGGGIG